MVLSLVKQAQRKALREEIRFLSEEAKGALADPDCNVERFELLKVKYGNLKSDLHEIDNEELETLETLEDVSDQYTSEAVREIGQHNKLLYEIEASINVLKRKFDLLPATVTQGNQGHQPVVIQASHEASVRVPRPKLPYFNGSDITKFPSFWDAFRSCVHENPKLHKIEKFHLLREALQGQAAAAIAGLSTTDINYAAAIDILQQRYGNSDFIVDQLIMKISNVHAVKSSSDTYGLRNMYDHVSQCIRQLEMLGKPITEISSAFYPIVLSALPADMQLQYQREEHISRSTPPINLLASGGDEQWHSAGSSEHSEASSPNSGNVSTKLEKLMTFLEREVESRELCSQFANMGRGGQKQQLGARQQLSSFRGAHSREQSFRVSKDSRASTSTFSVNAPRMHCIFCKSETHASKECKIEMLHEQKVQAIRDAHVCFRCLVGKHRSAQCRDNDVLCNKCNKKSHHTVMHRYELNNGSPNANNLIASSDEMESSVTQCSSMELKASSDNAVKETKLPHVLLKTATVFVRGLGGKLFPMKAIFDTGCQTTAISRRMYNTIRPDSEQPMSLNLGTVGRDSKLKVNTQYCEFDLHDGKAQKLLSMKAIVLDHVCTHTLTPLSENLKRALADKNIVLADSDIIELNSDKEFTIDLLIGGDYICRILDFSKTVSLTDDLVTMSTPFGNVLFGRDLSVENASSSVFRLNVTDGILKSFWELEHIGVADDPNVTGCKENSKVIANLAEGIVKVGTRYAIPLPWKQPNVDLSNNRDVAVNRLKGLLKRLKRDPDGFERYDADIQQLVKDGHAEMIPENEIVLQDNRPIYYMPHQVVVREDKETTKRRIVFDASSHGKDVPSLNEKLDPGPNLNPEMLKVLLNFRVNKVAIIGDIEKAFLQLELTPKDKDVFRFLWVKPDSDNQFVIVEYRMTRHPFGATCSPFVLAFTIRHHAKGYRECYPAASAALDSDIYVDDFISGADSVDAARKLRKDVVYIVSEAGMRIRKWRASDPVLDSEFRGDEGAANTADSDVFKVLGIKWNICSDELGFDLSNVLKHLEAHRGKPLTKRILLQVCASIFDPVGFLAPFVFVAKLMFQQLWKRSVGWDEALSNEESERFAQWCEGLSWVKEIHISRYLQIQEGCTAEIHTFCDASCDGYAAVAYLRLVSGQQVNCQVLMAKSRVAPIKQLTVPRLELLGAVLAARLRSYLQTNLRVNIHRFVFWTDSQIVLHWINAKHSNLRQFVNNRVDEILSLSCADEWHYVPGRQNPADVATRGLSGQKLVDCDSWWSGSSWLKDVEHWPSMGKLNADKDEPLPLSPAHFLIGRLLTALPSERVYNSTGQSREEISKQFLRRRAIIAHFWKRWSSEYLVQLRGAHCAFSPDAKSSVRPGDVVLIQADSTPKHLWPICRIVSCREGRDGLVRSCTVKLPSGHITTRAVQHIFPLELI